MAMQARLQRRRSPDNRLNICSADWKCPILGGEAKVAHERANERTNDVSSSRKRKVAPICTDRQVHRLRDERDRNRRLARHLRLVEDFPRGFVSRPILAFHAREINVLYLEVRKALCKVKPRFHKY